MRKNIGLHQPLNARGRRLLQKGARLKGGALLVNEDESEGVIVFQPRYRAFRKARKLDAKQAGSALRIVTVNIDRSSPIRHAMLPSEFGKIVAIAQQQIAAEEPKKDAGLRKAFGLFKRLGIEQIDGVEYQEQVRKDWD